MISTNHARAVDHFVQKIFTNEKTRVHLSCLLSSVKKTRKRFSSSTVVSLPETWGKGKKGLDSALIEFMI